MNQAGNLLLQNRRVLVTRPAQQSQNLCDLIRSAGGEPILLPVIEIREKSVSEREVKLLNELTEGDALIFISRNAARFIDHVVSISGYKFDILNVFAVGTGTRMVLDKIGIKNVICPEQGAGSEALLELEMLQEKAVQGTKIVIVRGEGGRELLQNTLRSRGANVCTIELYSRVKPEIEAASIEKIWKQTPPDVVLITSGEGLQNLIEITPPQERERLFNTPLVVISDRVRDMAISSGFLIAPRIVGDTADEILLKALIESLEERQNE